MEKNKKIKIDQDFVFFLSMALFAVSLVFVVVFVKMSAINNDTLKTRLISEKETVVKSALIQKPNSQIVISCDNESLSGCLNKVHQTNSLVAPPAGMAENIILISAILLGLLGVIVFLGIKFRWYY